MKRAQANSALEFGAVKVDDRWFEPGHAPPHQDAAPGPIIAAAVHQVLADKDKLAQMASCAKEMDGKSTPRSF